MEWFKINFEAVAVSLNTIEIIIKKENRSKVLYIIERRNNFVPRNSIYVFQ